MNNREKNHPSNLRHRTLDWLVAGRSYLSAFSGYRLVEVKNAVKVNSGHPALRLCVQRLRRAG